MSDVEFVLADGVGHIVLNRPKAINSLTLDMLRRIETQLIAWVDDERVKKIEIRGEGARGYCAGADVRELRNLVLAAPERGLDFLRDEYRLDSMIAAYPKPVTAQLSGISMGGGLGLGAHGSLRVGDASTKWAMPEVGIGLWPDVGVTYELSRCPGEIGTHLAMTGITIDGASALYAGLVDLADGQDAQLSDLALDRSWIDECYVGDDPVAIVTALENHSTERARAAGALIRTRSPLSVCVALEAVRRAAKACTVEQVLAQDLGLAANFVKNPDFPEGVRAQLVDKDYRPRWRHDRVEDVTRNEVLAMFDSALADGARCSASQTATSTVASRMKSSSSPREEKLTSSDPERREDTEGWRAIVQAGLDAYPEQTEPLQYTTELTYEQGGFDPLDGVMVYRASDPLQHWHYLGYGLSDLNDDAVTSIDDDGIELSGFGYELSLRVAIQDGDQSMSASTPPPWVPALLQALARQVVNSGEAFVPGSLVVNPKPLVQGVDTCLTCLTFIADPDLKTRKTSSGEVRFVQAICLTTDEAQAIGTVGIDRFLDVFTRLYPKGVTVLERESILGEPAIAATLGLPSPVSEPK